jgi:hypothetical protein
MGGDTGGRLYPVSSGTRSTRTQTETTGCRCQALARAPDPHSDRQAGDQLTSHHRVHERRHALGVRGNRPVDEDSGAALSVDAIVVRVFATVTEQCSRSPHGQFSMALTGALCLHENFRSVCPPVPRSAHAESAPNSGHPVHVRSKEEGCVAQRILLLAAPPWSGQGRPGHQLRRRTAPPTGPSRRRGTGCGLPDWSTWPGPETRRRHLRDEPTRR